MAFPTVGATTESSGGSGANATQHTITLPSHSAGDLLFVAFSNDGAATVSVGSGASFNVLTNTATAANRLTTWYFLATSSSHTLRLDTSASEGSAWSAYRINSGTHNCAVNVPQQGTAATGASVSPNPPTLTASWGSADNLWIVAYGWDGNSAWTSHPASYTGSPLDDRWAHANGCGIGMATQNITTATQDPGVATIASDDWVAQTIVIRPYQTTTHALASTAGTAQVDGVSTGTALRPLASTAGAAQVDATATGTRNAPLASTAGASQVDAAGVGTRVTQLSNQGALEIAP